MFVWWWFDLFFWNIYRFLGDVIDIFFFVLLYFFFFEIFLVYVFVFLFIIMLCCVVFIGMRLCFWELWFDDDLEDVDFSFFFLWLDLDEVIFLFENRWMFDGGWRCLVFGWEYCFLLELLLVEIFWVGWMLDLWNGFIWLVFLKLVFCLDEVFGFGKEMNWLELLFVVDFVK